MTDFLFFAVEIWNSRVGYQHPRNLSTAFRHCNSVEGSSGSGETHEGEEKVSTRLLTATGRAYLDTPLCLDTLWYVRTEVVCRLDSERVGCVYRFDQVGENG